MNEGMMVMQCLDFAYSLLALGIFSSSSFYLDDKIDPPRIYLEGI
jgi:hypothetical protein